MQTIMRVVTPMGESYTTTITIEEDAIYTSRIIGISKMVRLSIELNGTMKDLLAKCERVSKLDNEMYSMLSEISKSNEANKSELECSED